MSDELIPRPAPPGSGGFRRRLRHDFVRGFDDASPFEQELRLALAEDERRPAFASSLRERFAGGALERSGISGPDELERMPTVARRRTARRSPRRGPALAGVAALAAAAVALVVLVPRLRGPSAEAVEPDVARAEPAVTPIPSRAWTSTDEPIELTLSEGLRLRLLPGSELRAAPGSSGDDDLRLALARGEVLLEVESSYGGPRIVIETDDATVRVAEASLSVMTASAGTCVCVLTGRVLAEHDGDETTVGPEQTFLAERAPDSAGREPYLGDWGNPDGPLGEAYEEQHLAPLRAFAARRG